jgi:hypothetical protein
LEDNPTFGGFFHRSLLGRTWTKRLVKKKIQKAYGSYERIR